MEHILQTFRERIVSAGASRSALCIRGGGTKDWYGRAPHGEPLDTRSYAGIIAYDPSELVITVRCGTTMREIDAVLAAQNQMLAFEPPHFGDDATIGGAVACGLSGPRRQAVGSLRDFVLGTLIMDGKGEVLRFGGQVMKNVAGYDVSRLMVGAMGTLGLLLDISLKVLPKPFAEHSLCLAMNQADAIQTLNEWGSQPLPISASAWTGGVLMVRLSGAEAAVTAARTKIGGDELPYAQKFWSALRDQQYLFFAPDGSPCSFWRLSVPSVTPLLDLPGDVLIEWGGAQRWMKTGADPSE